MRSSHSPLGISMAATDAIAVATCLLTTVDLVMRLEISASLM